MGSGGDTTGGDARRASAQGMWVLLWSATRCYSGGFCLSLLSGFIWQIPEAGARALAGQGDTSLRISTQTLETGGQTGWELVPFGCHILFGFSALVFFFLLFLSSLVLLFPEIPSANMRRSPRAVYRFVFSTIYSYSHSLYHCSGSGSLIPAGPAGVFVVFVGGKPGVSLTRSASCSVFLGKVSGQDWRAWGWLAGWRLGRHMVYAKIS